VKIEHISVSRKLYYDQCQAAYKFKYHLCLPRDEGIEEPFYFIYGKIVHKIAEIYVKEKGKVSLKEISRDVLDGKISLGHEEKAPHLPREYSARLPKHIRALQRFCKKTGFDGLTEFEFNYDLDPPNYCFIKGFIDRVIIKNDKYFVIDYKTTKEGRFRKNKFTILSDLQLRIYAAVIKRTFPNVKASDITVALYYLDGPELIAAKFTDNALKQAETELLETYKRIIGQSPDDIIPNVGEHCKRCDYRYSCPFLRNT